MMDDDYEDVGGLPNADMDPDRLEQANIPYPAWNPNDTFVISGPLPHGVARSEADEARRMKRKEAKKWAKEKYGSILETIWHPHRWCIRIHKNCLRGAKNELPA